jgi:hypothetical protein
MAKKKQLTPEEQQLRQEAALIFLDALEKNAKWIGSKDWKKTVELNNRLTQSNDRGEPKQALFLKSYVEDKIKMAFKRATSIKGLQDLDKEVLKKFVQPKTRKK